MTCVLKAQNLKKVYGSKFNLYTALDDISLEID
jgi:ABC-type oligopeptide transport system ATPase subunit